MSNLLLALERLLELSVVVHESVFKFSLVLNKPGMFYPTVVNLSLQHLIFLN